MSNNSKYSGSYSEKSFWEKLSKHAGDAGKDVVLKALILFYCIILNKAKATQYAKIVAALGYFICPIDAIPDILPGGFVDDGGVLSLAIASMSCCKDSEVLSYARAKLRAWFR